MPTNVHIIINLNFKKIFLHILGHSWSFVLNNNSQILDNKKICDLIHAKFAT